MKNTSISLGNYFDHFVKSQVSAVVIEKDKEFISLTDMLKAKDGDFFISDWLRNRNTVEYLGIWESINNPSFNYFRIV